MTEETRFAPAIPARVGKGTRLNGVYEIDAYLTAGGMGEIFRGHTIGTGTTVAIKIVRPELAQDPMVQALFKKEACALHNLNHEAIVRYFLFSIDPVIGLPYVAMEYVECGSLSDMLQAGPLATDQALKLLHRLAHGLASAHQLGIVHRDLSPDNVLLPHGDVSQAKIIDFGIARSPLGGGTLIGSGFAGKMSYVSPEQLGLFGGDVGPRSDIYSLGLVIAEAASGAKLKMGESHVEVIKARRQVPDLARIDKALRPILQQMLQPDPDKRPGSMDEVAAWVPRELTVRPQASRPRRRSSRGLAAAAAVLVLLGGGGAALLTLRPDLLGLPGGVTEPGTAPLGGTPQDDDKGGLGDGGLGPGGLGSGGGGGRLGDGETEPVAPVPPPSPPPVPPPEPSPPPVRPPPKKPEPPTSPPPPPEPPPIAVSPPPPTSGGTVRPPPGGTPDTATRQEPPAPTAPTEDGIRAFLRQFDSEPCFAAWLVRAGPGNATIESFGEGAAAVTRLDQSFRNTFGFDARINYRSLAHAQCPLAAFLAREQSRGGRKPGVSLKADALRSGEELVATTDARFDKHVEMLLLSDDGRVRTLAPYAKRNGTSLVATLRLTTGSPPGSAATPQAVLVLASPAPVGDLLARLKADGLDAETFFKQLETEIGKGSTLALTAKYFKLSNGV